MIIFQRRMHHDPTVRPRPELKRLMDEGKTFEISLTDKAFLEFYLNHRFGVADPVYGGQIPRRIGCPEGLGAAGAFPRRWRAL